MQEKEIWKKIKEIEIKTNLLITNIFSGEYRSAFKGKGLEFKELKEYEDGDDVKNIDWKATARKGIPYVRKFEEERELIILLVADVSNSTFFGSTNQLKRELAIEFSASIAFSGLKNNDKIALILFDDDILEYIPPKKGKPHVLRILKKMLEYTYLENKARKTNLSKTLNFIKKLFKRKVVIFIISDFFTDNFENELKVLSFKHDVIAVITSDKREYNLPPNIGLIELEDPETHKNIVIDTSSKSFISSFNSKIKEIEETRNNILKKSKVDTIFLETDESFIPILKQFFQRREKRN